MIDPDRFLDDAARAEGTDGSAARLAAQAGMPLRVLIVDDEEDAFVIARDLLCRHSGGRFTSTWAATMDEGLRQLATGDVDVALVDYHLPVGDGLELVARARAAGSRTPIVLLTGRALEGTDVDALNAGAIDYLEKSDLSAQGLQRVVRLAVERARIAERLRHSLGLRTAVLNAIADGVVVTDRDGRVTSVNPSAAIVLGRSVADLIFTSLGSRDWEMVGEDGTPLAGDRHPALRTLASGEASPRVVVGMARPDGSRAWISLTVSALVRPGESAPYGAVLSFSDVTAFRALADELRQAQKMEAIGRLAGGIAHDFNNLLTVISGYSDLILSDLPDDDIHWADVDEISRAAARGADLTRQLLAFGRRQMLQPIVLDLDQSIGELVSLLIRVVGEDVALDLRSGPERLHVRMDAGQLEQILLNLAQNARDAMPKGGRLTIETRRSTVGAASPADDGSLPEGPWVVLSVADTGIGMDAQTRAHAFEPFYTTKDVGHGTGLGLASVYGAVRQSGGHVRLRSEPGQGTTVDIYLPPETGPATLPAAAPGRSLIGGSESVLVVDDEESVCGLVAAILVRRGYIVRTALDGAEALRIAQDGTVPLDLLVTDVIMPGQDGWEVAAQVTALRPGIGVIFMSGFAGHAVVRDGLVRPGIEFLAKPISSSDLLGAVRRVLDGRGGAPGSSAGTPA